MAFDDSIKDADLAQGLIKKAAQRLLDATDWTQIPNNGLTDTCVTAFNEYRVAIRTIRQTNPDNPTWPDAPTEEWS